MSEINVEKIMEEIREDIKRKGYTEDMLSFKDIKMPVASVVTDFNIDEFRDMVSQAQVTKVVSWRANNIGGGIKGLIKKVIRKMVGFVVAPLADSQNVFNQNAANIFLQLVGYVESQNKLIEQYEERIGELQNRVEELENK